MKKAEDKQYVESFTNSDRFPVAKRKTISNVEVPCFVSVGEAAAFLRIAPSTIYGLVHQRRIPFRKHGRRLAFKIDELMEWSDSNKYSELSDNCSYDLFQYAINRAGSLKTEQSRMESHPNRKEV